MPMRSVCVFVVFLCVWASGPVLCKAAQEGSLPKDPAALFALAREKNGLESSDVRPWHIRGSYTFYDIKSNVGDKGVYEEWWVSAARYKRSFTGQKFTQTEYATGGRLLRTGSQDWPSSNEMLLRSSLIEPLLYDSILKEFILKRHTKSIGKYKLDCVFFTYPVRGDQIVYDDFFPHACFDPTILALRVTSTKRRTTLFLTFRGISFLTSYEPLVRTNWRWTLRLTWLKSFLRFRSLFRMFLPTHSRLI
jgi:hypothetical protein